MLDGVKTATWRAAFGGPANAVARAVRRAGTAWASAIGRFSLFQRFALLSLAILVVGAYVIGSYVSGEIKGRVIQRTSALTALYVDSFVSPHLQELKTEANISAGHLAELDRLLFTSSLGQKIVSFKIWDRNGGVVYASEPSLIGRQFPVVDDLEKALSGDIQTSISDLQDEENLFERQQFSELLETYAPVHGHDSGEIIGVSEFYQNPADLESEIASSQRRGWLIVGGATAVMYLMLVGMVRGASNTIARQHGSLQQMARQNAHLADRVRHAAAQKSETDERLLMRIAQDLHDGPAQDVSLALLRLESKAGAAEQKTRSQRARDDIELMRRALESALKEIRQISAGLRLPEMEGLTLPQVVEKAVQEHREKTGNGVRLALGRHLPEVSLPVKIALYRVTQEALNNAYQHAGVTEEEVQLRFVDGAIQLQIRDNGVGLEGSRGRSEAAQRRMPLGVRGMRERVEMLGGALEISSDEGTTVRVVLPVAQEDSNSG